MGIRVAYGYIVAGFRDHLPQSPPDQGVTVKPIKCDLFIFFKRKKTLLNLIDLVRTHT